MAKKPIISENQEKYSPVWYYNILFVFIAFLFYGNSIKNGYSMDDEYVTTTPSQKNALTELGVGGLKKIFTSHSFKDGKQNYEYRPVSIYTFAVEWSLFKNNENRVHFSHTINVLLYGITGILLFQLLQILFQGKASTLSAITVILFLIHPIHSEVVDSIKNRDELLSLIFALLAAIQTFRWVDSKNWWRIFLAALFIMLSLLSKKSNLPFIISIPLMLYFFRKLNLKTIGISFLILFTVKIGFNLFKNHLMNLDDTATRHFNTFENPLFDLGFIERIPMFFYTNLIYIEKLFFPYPLAYYYGYDAIKLVGFTDWQFYLGLISMLAALYFALKGFMKKSVLSFGILFFFLAIGGVANLLSPMVGIIAERFAFSASIGFCLVIAFLFSQWKKDEFEKNKISFSIVWPLLILVIPSFLYTLNRNHDWASKKSLYLADIQNVPRSAKANSLLASEYQVEAMTFQKEINISYQELIQKVDSAIYFYDKSLTIYKNYESNLNNKGVLLYTYKYDYQEAFSLFNYSVKVNTGYKEGYLNCGNSMAKMAEGFNDLVNVSTLADSTLNITNDELNSFEKVYLENKTYQAIAILKQFELNIRDFYNKGNKNDLKNRIIENSQNLESNCPLLQQKKMTLQVSKILSKNVGTIEQSIKTIFAYVAELKKETLNDLGGTLKIKSDKLQIICKKLKKKYILKAKSYFKKAQDLSKNDKNLYSVMMQFARISQDFEWLAEIQLDYIQKFPKEYLGANYSELINAYVFMKNDVKAKEYCTKSIQIEQNYIRSHKKDFLGEHYVRMANAYLTLKENKKAIENFKNGAEEFKREREFLTKKSSKTQTDAQRIEMLNRELQNLKQFKESLLNKK